MSNQSHMRAVLLGSGNVASHLGHALSASGVEVLQVYSPSPGSAERLAEKLGCGHTDRIASLNPRGDIYIIAVTDDAIAGVASHFPFGEKLLVHTSGSVAMDVLQKGSSRHGVFYPLQTFSADVAVDFSEVPLCLESSNSRERQTLEALARKLSEKVVWIDSRERRLLHVAAVFACNFVNHMYTAASDVLSGYDLPFDLLHPLIAETARKARSGDPSVMQTGPARRNDQAVIGKHAEVLKNDPELRKLYIFISESITKRYHR